MSAGIALLVSLVLLILNGFFVAAEFGLLAARRARLEVLATNGSVAARVALEGLNELTTLLAGAQLGITMCSLGIGIFAESAFAGLIEGPLHQIGIQDGLIHPIAFVFALSITSFLHMVVGEMLAKSLALVNPERTTLVVARPFMWMIRLFRPVVGTMNYLANLCVRAVGVKPTGATNESVGPAELVVMVNQSAQQGLLSPFESRLLDRTIRLQGLVAHQVMTPRRDMVWAHPSATPREIEQLSTETGRSRVLLLDEDNPVGLVHIKDVLLLPESLADEPLPPALIRECLTVVATAPVSQVMKQLRDRAIHVAIVIDEFGAIEGLVTLEDTIEELVGEFFDETDERPVEEEGEIPAQWRIDELAVRRGIHLPEGRYETVAGYVLDQTQEIPAVGTTIQIDNVGTGDVIQPAIMEVIEVQDHRVVTVAIQLLEAYSSSDDERM
ncbi:hemolysin family protein [Stomatohabitans albus]|uniref:hemolysin family protein n=1 Tax=Stomatohabitans albus TaxID=3110766 RepID=UPI00300D3B1E